MKDIKILVLKNNFSGSFNSFSVLYEELMNGLENLGIKFYCANNVIDAKKVMDNENISFSICIGKYEFFYNEKPLYNIYKIVNYQWIIDNPLKYDLDSGSKYNRLIMIDREFLSLRGFNRYDYLILSHGMPEFRFEEKSRENGILVPMKIMDMDELIERIRKSEEQKNVLSFLKSYEWDVSFIKQYNLFVETHEIKDEKLFFRLCNSYVRSKKRIDMINSVKCCKLYVLSDKRNKYLVGNNIEYLPATGFKDTIKLMQEYKYVLNSNPNFNQCLHERISYALANGAVVITEENLLLKDIDFPVRIKYSDFNRIDCMINDLSCSEDYNYLQRKCVEEFSIENQLQKLISHYNQFLGELYEL